MSKQYNIRWGRSDYSKLSHLVRKVNKKVFEIEVTRPDIADYQPAMLDYQSAKELIKTRADFNKFVHKYERYLREGSEELKHSERGAKATKWEVREFNIMQRADNIRKTAMRKRLEEEEVTIAGKSTGNKRAEMGSVLINATEPSKKNFKNMSQDDWRHAFNQFEQKMYSSYSEGIRMKQMRNYVKGLIAEGYDDELVDLLKHVSFEDFDKVFYSDEIATIDFIYDPAELKIKNELLKDLWTQFYDDEIENDFGLDEINKEIKYEYEHGYRIKGTGRIKGKKYRKSW